jgi:ATPase subunit of ABC transporter with duplicated ATPase domains
VVATLVASDVGVVLGGRTVLEHVTLTVAPGTRLGVVGPNGVGKSTLLRALGGRIALDAGTVRTAPPTASVGLLPQEPRPRPGERVADYIERRTGVAATQRSLDEATAALAEGADRADDAYAEALEHWLALGGADLPERSEAVCAELGLDPALLGAETATLSGGQAARASLASLVLSRFDVTLLDEPTNDLDFAGLDRLERFMTEVRGGLVVVSHDRELLARTVTAVAEVDQHKKDVKVYEGGWDSYLAMRDLARRHAREAYDAYEDRRDDLVAQAQRQREQSVRGALRAKRKRPDNDRSVAAHKLESATHAASRVKAIESNLARLEEVEEPRKEWELRLSLAVAPRSGDVVATLRDAVVDRGEFRLGPVDLAVAWADRVLITGANGSGKTTLLRALLGEVPLSSGAQHLGPGVVIGGIDQARAQLRGERSLLTVVEQATDWAPAAVRTLLAKFGLGADDVLRPAGSLSPGERTRGGLALLQAIGTNCLVLDEPTNHLDLPAIEQLELALADYPGTVLLVTHDRRMLDAVDVTRRILIERGRINEELA